MEPVQYVESAIAASKRYDSEGLRQVLLQARMQFG